MSKQTVTETGVPVPQEVFADQPNTVVDFEAEILANENLPEEAGEGQVPTLDEIGVALKVDPTAAAMLRVAESMEKIVARNESTRQLSYAEILPVTPWNPEGKRNRVGFKRPTFMHGIQLNPLMHSEEEMALFNKLKPGRYIDRKVEVQLTQQGEINIQWAGARADTRIEMYTRFPSITLLLNAVIAEREAKESKRRAGRFDEDEDVY